MISAKTHKVLASFINLSYKFGLVPFKMSSNQFSFSCPPDSAFLVLCQEFLDYLIKVCNQFGILSPNKNNSNAVPKCRAKYSFAMLLTLHSVGRVFFLACIAAGSSVHSNFGVLDTLMACCFCSLVIVPTVFQVGIQVFRQEICNCCNALGAVMRPIGKLE